MTGSGIALDRIILDGVSIHPRSAMLRIRPSDRALPGRSPWWVYVASERLPSDLHTSDASVGFRGQTAGGREFGGEVQILGRRDSAYGTELTLSGLRPLAPEAGMSAHR
jgi:hypothetical protein